MAKTFKGTEEDFSSYMDLAVSEHSKDRLNLFFSKYPEIREEVFQNTKNAMMSTIYRDNQTREYINGVKDTLKFMSKYF